MQAYKRAPIDPPWPLRAAPRPNAKALALALSGYASPAGRKLAGAQRYLCELPEKLASLNLMDGVTGAAWGYPFDAQTRHLFYDRNTPNAIATCFVVGALLDAHGATGDDALVGLALAARPYLISLRREDPAHGPFFAYVAAGSQFIHNANILVCGALARLHDVDPDDAARSMAIECGQTTIERQSADSLWPYGEAQNLRWADNFHTAYTLEGLARLESSFGIGTNALDSGLVAWRRAFFESDDCARYYPNRRYPLEPHSFASAIDLLSLVCARMPDATSFARAIARAAVRELWLPDERRFAFRRTARRLNRRSFMRWTNAPMFRALAILNPLEGTSG